MKPIITSLTALLLLTAPLRADDAPTRHPTAVEGVWGIGSTGIMCYRAPCPSRGMFMYDPDNPGPLSPQDVMILLPRLAGSEADQREIEAAWAESRCVYVEGRIDDGILHVDRIAGAC